MSTWTPLLAGASCVTAGVFLGFSAIVMPALDRLPPRNAVAAMQAIDGVAVRPLFMTVLFAPAVLALPAAVSLRDAGPSEAVLVLTGTGLYLVGVLATTVGYHVPRNRALQRWDAGSPEAAAGWHRWSTGWVRLNHLRCVAGAAAAVAFALASR